MPVSVMILLGVGAVFFIAAWYFSDAEPEPPVIVPEPIHDQSEINKLREWLRSKRFCFCQCYGDGECNVKDMKDERITVWANGLHERHEMFSIVQDHNEHIRRGDNYDPAFKQEASEPVELDEDGKPVDVTALPDTTTKHEIEPQTKTVIYEGPTTVKAGSIDVFATAGGCGSRIYVDGKDMGARAMSVDISIRPSEPTTATVVYHCSGIDPDEPLPVKPKKKRKPKKPAAKKRKPNTT